MNMKKTATISLNVLPIVLMVGLVPAVPNEAVLSFVYVVIILAAFGMKRERNDGAVFIFGFFAMTVAEYFFVSTGVEVFARRGLFGLMPLWLPLLWGYGFVVIKRAVRILDK